MCLLGKMFKIYDLVKKVICCTIIYDMTPFVYVCFAVYAYIDQDAFVSRKQNSLKFIRSRNWKWRSQWIQSWLSGLIQWPDNLFP